MGLGIKNTTLIGIGIFTIAAYYIWKQSKKKSLVGVPPIQYEFKNFVEPEVIFQEDGLMPQFGRPLIIKNRKK